MFEGLLQPSHLLIVLVIVLIVFGPGKLPELGKALGQGVRELRESAGGKSPDAPAVVETRQIPAPTQPQAAEPPEDATGPQA